MRVFNLTGSTLVYRGKSLAPGVGADFPELNTFIPDRDKKMAEAKVISFNTLPRWYSDKKAVRPPALPTKSKVLVVSEPILPEAKYVPPPMPVREENDWVEKPIGKKNR